MWKGRGNRFSLIVLFWRDYEVFFCFLNIQDTSEYDYCLFLVLAIQCVSRKVQPRSQKLSFRVESFYSKVQVLTQD